MRSKLFLPILSILLLVVTPAILTTSCVDRNAKEPIILLKTTEGDIKFKLYKETPLHRDNFMKLVDEKYFDGRIFHRVIDGFMIQAGNAGSQIKNQEGFQEPQEYTIEAEILSQYRHKVGAVAAARMGDDVNPEKRSSATQFYIVQSEDGTKHLNDNYTVFGQTLAGFDIIDKIAKVETGDPFGWTPVKEVIILSVKQVRR